MTKAKNIDFLTKTCISNNTIVNNEKLITVVAKNSRITRNKIHSFNGNLKTEYSTLK